MTGKDNAKVTELINKTPSIAVLIPTLNGGKLWPQLLESIDGQNLKEFKKVIIDSGSTDDTVNLAKQHGFEVKTIAKQDFNHGRVRQQLADSTDAEICIFLTQDAILASANSLENIVKEFEDPDVGLAYGRQLPHQNATVLETHLRLFNYPATSEKLSLADAERKGFKVFFCSNSFSAYRKSALIEVGGFPSDSIMGEDAIVAAKMLLAGYSKVYAADATVYHSHSYNLEEEFRRYFDTRVFHEQNQWLIKKYGKPTGEGIKYFKSELLYVINNDLKSIFKSISSLGAKWIGYKSGKYYDRMPKNMLLKFSMHSAYWK